MNGEASASSTAPATTAAGDAHEAGAVPGAPAGTTCVEAGGSPSTPGRADWVRALRYCLKVYIGVRVGLFLVGLLSTALLPRNNPVDVPGWPATDPAEGWHNVFTAWERFDALWFLRIASQGYRDDDGSAAFFPGYPLLARGVANLLGNQWLLGAYVVSNVALVVALVLLYRLTSIEFSEERARRTILYLCIFPTGFFLFSPYSESLFLALSVGCLYAARRHHWLLAGYLGALSSLTRSTGLLLMVPLAVEAALQLRASSLPMRKRVRCAAAGLAASAAVPLGMLAYFGYWARFADDWRRPLDVQGTNWSKDRSWPWETILAGAKEGTRYFGAYAGGYHTVDLVLVGLALLAGVWVLVRVRLSYALYYWASLLFPMTLAFGGRPFMSVPRYILVIFPLFWALAALADRWRGHEAVVASSAAGLGLLSLLFVNWFFIF